MITELEFRYYLFKVKDVEQVLTNTEKEILEVLANKISQARIQNKQPMLKAVVIEHDWPEYEPTVKTLLERVNKQEGKLPWEE